MRVRVAYISSLGTTAILLAAALTLLTVVGAIVAFRGWPEGAGGSGVQSVPLAPGTSPAPAAVVRRSPATRSKAAGVRKAAAHHAAAHASTAGLVKTDAAGPPTVPGLVMVQPYSGPRMVHHSTSVTQLQPGAEPAPELPADPQRQPPLPSPGSDFSLPQAPPPPDQVTAMASELLSGGSSPPPAPALNVVGIEVPLP
jgi:hypothetical protein